MRVNSKGYIERRINTGHKGKGAKPIYRNWYVPTYQQYGNSALLTLPLQNVRLPDKYAGKKLMIHIEEVKK